MLTITRVALIASLLAVSAAAHADDEGSEHTAVLEGAAADTRGVSVDFDRAKGWSLRFFASGKRVALPLDKRHAHYVVAVTEGRKRFVIWTVSRGGREISSTTSILWILDSRGAPLREWAVGGIFSDAEVDELPRSVSHVRLSDSKPTIHRQRVTINAHGRRVVTIHADRPELRSFTHPPR